MGLGGDKLSAVVEIPMTVQNRHNEFLTFPITSSIYNALKNIAVFFKLPLEASRTLDLS